MESAGNHEALEADDDASEGESSGPLAPSPPVEPGPTRPAYEPANAPPDEARASLPEVLRPRAPERFIRAFESFFQRHLHAFRRYFANEPRFLVVLGPFMVVTTLLYCRFPWTNYIFDEQEALLANPYVNRTINSGKVFGEKYTDAPYVDFWGLPPNASIGSYRPIPNYLWRAVVELGDVLQKPFDFVMAHAPYSFIGVWAVVGALVAFVLRRVGLQRWRLAIATASAATVIGAGLIVAWILRAHIPAVPALTDLARRSFFQQIYNLVFHAVNGALATTIAWRYSKNRFFAWMAGGTFITAAILTEAVCGCVGLADVLGGMGALLALAALSMRAYAMPFGVFLAVLLGLFAKESAVVCVPLVPFAALVAAPVIHPEKPARFVRAVLAFAGTVSAFVLYVEMRKLWFPSPLPSEFTTELPPFAGKTQVFIRDFMVWFHQPPLPHDPLNNPFADPKVGPDYRLAGALRVYERGLGQVVFPLKLAGDYSSPQEPVPDNLIFGGSIAGAIATLAPVGAAIALFFVGIKREITGPRVPVERPSEVPSVARRVLLYVFELSLVLVSFLLVRKMLSLAPAPLPDSPDANPITIGADKLIHWGRIVALGCLVTGALTELFWRARKQSRDLWAISAVSIGLMWLVVSYFPHSNIPALLPTVRAERLWYFPVIGTTMVIATALVVATSKLRQWHLRRAAVAVPLLFLGFQAVRARTHALDYWDDLAFWDATKDTVPNSSKAHLNYSVMVGARGDYQTRLEHSLIAIKLAPKWAMAHIYTGDTLCRMHRADEAWPHYKDGFALGENDKGLISLALQCMWDEHILLNHEQDLRDLANDHQGSWLTYLIDDTLDNGGKNGGVAAEYRPRNYNEGPKKKGSGSGDADDTAATDDTATDSSDVESAEGSAGASADSVKTP